MSFPERLDGDLRFAGAAGGDAGVGARLCEPLAVSGPLYGRLFRRMLRGAPRRGQWIVSGGAYVLAAALLVNCCFASRSRRRRWRRWLLGDAFAALIGRRFGRHKTVNGKSWEGVAAFLIFGWRRWRRCWRSPRGGGALCRRRCRRSCWGRRRKLFEKQLRVDDNFSIPLCVGAVMELAARLGGCSEHLDRPTVKTPGTPPCRGGRF